MERTTISEHKYISYRKILIFGDSKVGKTSFIKGINNNFEFDYIPSSFISSNKISITINDNKLDAHIFEINTDNYDDKYLKIYSPLLTNCKCVLFFFDVTNETSFIRIKAIIEIIENIDNENKVPKFVVANKIDDTNNRSVSIEKIEEFCLNQIKPLQKFEISTKKKENVDNLINAIIEVHRDYKSRKEQIRDITIYESEMSNKNNFLNAKTVYKIILLGDGDVGKSSFFQRYFKDNFEDNYMMTMGINDSYKYIKINENEIKLQIWDTAGQERFRSLPRKYYQHADGIILLYDVTNRKSFESVTKWLKDIKDNTQTKIITYIVGNKIDLFDSRVIEQSEAKETFKDKYEKIKILEISCKLDINITETLMKISQDIYEEYCNKRIFSESFILNNSKHNKAASCCGSEKEIKN